MRSPACETTCPTSYRSSISGFTISARCPAISARRSRRISSSLLPLNIGPQTSDRLDELLVRLDDALDVHPPRLLEIASSVRPRTPTVRDAPCLVARRVPKLSPVIFQPRRGSARRYQAITTRSVAAAGSVQ